MPAKLGGNHKAKLASCLAIHKNSLVFPMRDCVVCCDPHTGARLQRFALPPVNLNQPSMEDVSLSHSVPYIFSTFQLSSRNVIPSASLTEPEAWIMSSFVLSGDMLFVATYHGWIGIFSLSHEKMPQAKVSAPATEAIILPPAENQESTIVILRCERFWQTAGPGVLKGAVVNSISVIMNSGDASSKQSMDTIMDNRDTKYVASRVEDAVAAIVTVVDYGNSLTMWKKY